MSILTPKATFFTHYCVNFYTYHKDVEVRVYGLSEASLSVYERRLILSLSYPKLSAGHREQNIEACRKLVIGNGKCKCFGQNKGDIWICRKKAVTLQAKWWSWALKNRGIWNSQSKRRKRSSRRVWRNRSFFGGVVDLGTGVVLTNYN